MSPPIRVYSRRGCHLCEELLEGLAPLIRGRATLTVCDVDTRSDWLTRFNEKVPVVELDGEVICEYFLDRDALERALLRAERR